MMQVFCEDVEPHVHEPWGYNPMQGFATALEAQYPAGGAVSSWHVRTTGSCF